MWKHICELLFCMGVVQAVLAVLLNIAERNREVTDYSLVITQQLRLLCLLSGEAVFACGRKWQAFFPVCSSQGNPFWGMVVYTALGVVAGCLLMACVTDCQNCMIYQYVWWIGGSAGICLVLLALQENYSSGSGKREAFIVNTVLLLLKILVIGLLQEVLFSRMYGRADCHAFWVCGVVQCAMGLGIREHLLQMLLAVMVLAVVQGVQKNIDKKGSLKKAVPFLPYISLSFWLVLVGI